MMVSSAETKRGQQHRVNLRRLTASSIPRSAQNTIICPMRSCPSCPALARCAQHSTQPKSMAWQTMQGHVTGNTEFNLIRVQHACQ